MYLSLCIYTHVYAYVVDWLLFCLNQFESQENESRDEQAALKLPNIGDVGHISSIYILLQVPKPLLHILLDFLSASKN